MRYGRLSTEAVAKRAGVDKSALYRRRPSEQDMVISVIWQEPGGPVRARPCRWTPEKNSSRPSSVTSWETPT
ncbi:helix-turn-helix domain-containing protein [Pseudonocardia adelaidensis]|uniref:helix-turn-helix domain-containing protein n=1 Tax=Pseudonocardia adelaidensis TaxID=648754 RepID=UPI0031EE1F1F